ncbi:MAG: NfeD family protein [Xenococcus sp. (in: cyanobacteria)]
MNIPGYPYRKQYGIVKQRIANDNVGTIELLDTIFTKNNIWYAQCLTDKIVEPGTEVYVVGQKNKTLLVETVLG